MKMIKVLTITSLLLIANYSFCQNYEYQVYAIEFADDDWKAIAPKVAIGATTKDSVRGCFMIWLLTNSNGKNILIDAGFTDSTKTKKFTRPDRALKKMNIKPSDITDVIVTHPHWDHIGGVNLFPEAKVWMQKEDYEYFVGMAWQEDGSSGGFDKNDVRKIVEINLDGRLKLVNGDDIEIIPGIKVFTGSKHTFESQYVLVNSGSTDKRVIIASDNIWFYYNLEHLLPIPYTFDSAGYVNAMKRMKTLVSSVNLIIPGHDILVFDKFPKIKDGVAIIIE